MKNYKRPLFLGVLMLVIFPSVTFAAWWNPFTWNWFRKVQTVQQIMTTTNPGNPFEDLIPKNNQQESTNTNLDTTCLAFYRKLQALSAPQTSSVNNIGSELARLNTLIDQATLAHESTVMYENQRSEIKARILSGQNNELLEAKAKYVQKQTLMKNYSFCYEYLAKTYGYIF